MIDTRQLTPNDFLGRLNNWKVIAEEDILEGDIIYVSGFSSRPIVKKYRADGTIGTMLGVASHKIPQNQVGEMVFEFLVHKDTGTGEIGDVLIVDSTGAVFALKDAQTHGDNNAQQIRVVGVVLATGIALLAPGRSSWYDTNIADYNAFCPNTSGATSLIIPGEDTVEKNITRQLKVFKIECKVLSLSEGGSPAATITFKVNGSTVTTCDLTDSPTNDIAIIPGLESFLLSKGDILTTEVVGSVEFYLHAYPTVG